MINDEIIELREKLHASIEKENDYQIIYKRSIELDKLISKKIKLENKKMVCYNKFENINVTSF